MGKQSNLGPIDPQFGGIPAHGVLKEFEQALKEIKADPASIPLWQTIIGKYHPTFLGECRNAILLAGEVVKKQLQRVMFAGDPDDHTEATTPTKVLRPKLFITSFIGDDLMNTKLALTIIAVLWTSTIHARPKKTTAFEDTSGITKDLLFVLSPNMGVHFSDGNAFVVGGVGSVYYFPIGLGIGGLTNFESYQLEVLAKLHLGMFGYSVGAFYSPEKHLDGLWDVWFSFFAIVGVRYRKEMGDDGAHAIQIFCPLMFWNQWKFGQVPKRMNYIR